MQMEARRQSKWKSTKTWNTAEFHTSQKQINLILSASGDLKLFSCAQQMDYYGIIMLYDRQQHLIWPQYLPRLSDWVACVGVLLVFILFRAPLTISEMWDKPNHIKQNLLTKAAAKLHHSSAVSVIQIAISLEYVCGVSLNSSVIGPLQLEHF